MRTFVLFSFMLSSLITFSQKELPEGENIKVMTPVDSARKQIRTATLLSTALPGSGQVYNKKYWKVPIVYAGLGACIYYIKRNTDSMNHFRSALVAELDDDALTINTTGYNSSQLDEIVDTYTRWRDISWMVTAGVYILNIIDANVDAHLRQFEVSDDLTLRWSPFVRPELQGSAGLTLTLQLK